jgi:DNA-binding FadR family transcriptional regulator
MRFDSVSVVRPYEQIVAQVEQRIRDGRLARGAKLPTERELAETFGVSRSVVREAVKVLDAMGLVTSRQGSGLYVRNDPIPTVTRAFTLSVSPDAESVEHLFEFRQGLEMDAARLAAERRTDDHIAELEATVRMIADAVAPPDWTVFAEADVRFHRVIADASDNPYLRVAIATAREMQQDIVSLFAERLGSMQNALNHHQRVADAIQRRDAAAAAAAMGEHISYTAQVVQEQIATGADPTRAR